MAGGIPQSSRNNIQSHHSTSTSLPSTPQQRSKAFSRSPSPSRELNGNHSPRSTASETRRGHPASSSFGRPVCKYERSIPGRRRAGYDNDTLLEKPNQEPKKALDASEDAKLTAKLEELARQLEPTEESKERRKCFIHKLEQILRRQWPGYDHKIRVFGSSGNELYTSNSDGMVQNELLHSSHSY